MSEFKSILISIRNISNVVLPEVCFKIFILLPRIHHKSTGEDSFTIIESSVTSHTFYNLTPNTQYIIYVTANSTHGKSMPSETLIAWTDPAYPAFVEVHNGLKFSITIIRKLK